MMSDAGTRRGRGVRVLVGIPLVLAGAALLWRSQVSAQETEDPVYVIEVRGSIDLGLAAYLSRALKQAQQDRARAVILELDTPGGRLDAVLQMRDALLDTPVRTIAYVNRTAFSAGALLAIAADEIYMTPGAVLGAATPVDGSGAVAEEKVVSAVRSTFRSTADVRGRDPRIAEAMVDPEVAIDGLVRRGQLLTLTTAEAREWGYADGVADDRAALLTMTGLGGAPVVETTPELAERLVRFLTTPIVASLLISLGILLLLMDLFTAGFGLAGVIGLALLAIFFWGHFIAGLAGWEGVALVALGLALIGLELFVIPGFGVAGLAGLLALLGGLFISLIGEEIITRQALVRAGSTIALAVITIVAGGVALFWLLPQLPWLRGLILQTNVSLPRPVDQRRALFLRSALDRERPNGAARAVPAEPRTLVGATGVAMSDLRPAGFAEIAGARVDVITRGEFIPAGAPIEVIADEGYRRVVRRPALSGTDQAEVDTSDVR